jgi:hypothetical protein
LTCKQPGLGSLEWLHAPGEWNGKKNHTHAQNVDWFYKMTSTNVLELHLPKLWLIGKDMSLSFILHAQKLQSA